MLFAFSMIYTSSYNFDWLIDQCWIYVKLTELLEQHWQHLRPVEGDCGHGDAHVVAVVEQELAVVGQELAVVGQVHVVAAEQVPVVAAEQEHVVGVEREPVVAQVLVADTEPAGVDRTAVAGLVDDIVVGVEANCRKCIK